MKLHTSPMIAVLFFFLLLISSCKKNAPNPVSPDTSGPTYEQEGIIGTSGGTVHVTNTNSPLTNAYVSIPSGSLASNTTISIALPTKKYSFEGDSTKLCVSLEPSGTVFQNPVTIGIPYNPTLKTDSIQIYYYADSVDCWKPILTTGIDPTKRIVTAQTNHFTTFTASKSGISFDITLFNRSNKISARVKLLTPLTNVPTNPAYAYRAKNMLDLLEDINYTHEINAYFRVTLKEKVNFWLDPFLETRSIRYDIVEFSLGGYQVSAYDENYKSLYLSPNRISYVDLEKIYSGEPMLFEFPNTQISSAKQYYVEVYLYYVNENTNIYNSWATQGYYASSFTNAQTPGQMVAPPDADGDGIVDSYDLVYGNPPLQPFSPSPIDNATGQSTSTTLGWTCSDPDGDPLTFDIYFGTSSNPSLVASSKTSMSYNPGALNNNATYYWQIIAKDNHSNSTSSPVWRFGTVSLTNNLPAAPSSPSPSDLATSVSTSPTLSWNCSDPDGDAIMYDVYLDTNNPPTKQVATGQNPKTFSASGLINNTPYFWKITAKDSKGATTTGPVWKFTTIAAGNNPPTAPSSPNPADLATGVSTSPTLSWSCSDPDGDAITYDVYLDMNNPPTKQVATGQGPKTFAATGLTNNTPYFWKIVAKDSKGATTTGPVWKFTTESGQIVQDMIVVNGGTFTAGTTPVTISRFTIDKYEVTFEVWTDIRNWALTHGYTDLPTGSNGNQPIGTNNPVTNVNWFDVIKWCNARSEKNGLTPIYYTDTTQSTIYRTGSLEIDWDTNEMVKWGANGFRLPTETEWEFAARGGTQSHGYTYSGSDTVGKVAWYYDNSYPSTHSVGQLQPNELGIYDMSGNATEWCWDYFDVPYPSGGTIDPRGPMWSSSSRRVQRGGNALSWEGYCLVDREHVELNFPENFDTSVGFRCVKN